MKDPSRLRIEGEMTVYNALEIQERLLSALEHVPEVELDLASVSDIDTAGCQLLLMAKREANRLGKSLRLVGHSQSVLDVLAFYNVAAFFGDPLVIPAHDSA